MRDKQKILHGSLIQHGKSNDRIYLMSYNSEKREELYRDLIDLAEKEEYGKIFIKVPQLDEDFFLVRGFRREAVIPRFYPGFDCILMGYYLDEERKELSKDSGTTIRKVLEVSCLERGFDKMDQSGVSIKKLTEEHIKEMAGIYKKVFPSYPFPIDNPSYLKETMNRHVYYFGCFREENLIGLSSAETDPATGAVEMTDFAVLPEYRGENLACSLLKEMEKSVREMGFRVAFTIARAVSFGMNKTFAKADYTFGGTLINNTQISGSIESMNVWHKNLMTGL